MIGVVVVFVDLFDFDSFCIDWILFWLVMVVDVEGCEYVVLFDGWYYIWFDVEEGWLIGQEVVLFYYRLCGLVFVENWVLLLCCFFDLCWYCCFV